MRARRHHQHVAGRAHGAQGELGTVGGYQDVLDRHPDAAAVRLGVAPAGCSGLRYRVELAGAVCANDTVFESGGVRIAVDAASLPLVQGTRLDLVQEGLAQKLRFDNPNARSSCGCGESFGT